MPDRAVSLLGYFTILAICVAFSRDRKAIRWKSVGMGLALQLTLGITILGIPSLGVPGIFRFVFELLSHMLTALVDFTGAGAKFLFGPLAEAREPWGFVFAFRALPSIVFFSSLMALLYHIGLLQKVVRAFATVMQKTMRTSGAETLSIAANMFVGQTEAPMMVKPFLNTMTQSEIYTVMVGGMSTIAGGVEAVYISLLQDRVHDIAGHLLTASCMAAVGALVISKIIFPEKGKPETAGHVKLELKKHDANAVDAVSRGASEGIMLAINVAAMLLAFISLIALFDACIGKVGMWLHIAQPLSSALIMSYVCRPFAWLLGVPWSESQIVGRLIGEKIIMNEFVAYVHLAENAKFLSDRTMLISSYVLCGFANISSIGIQIGGIGGMAPAQKHNLAKLGFLAVLGGTLSCFLSASIAGMLF